MYMHIDQKKGKKDICMTVWGVSGDCPPCEGSSASFWTTKNEKHMSLTEPNYKIKISVVAIDKQVCELWWLLFTLCEYNCKTMHMGNIINVCISANWWDFGSMDLPISPCPVLINGTEKARPKELGDVDCTYSQLYQISIQVLGYKFGNWIFYSSTLNCIRYCFPSNGK